MSTPAFHFQWASFRQQLCSIDTKAVTQDAYALYYLRHLINHSEYYLSIYARMFELAMERSEKPWKDCVILDIGAGNGLLGIFAGYCGCKKVYLNEPDPAFMNASKQLAALLGVEIHEFITADAAQLAKYPFIIQPDVIFGADVIEHIYDLETFVNTMSLINPFLVAVFTTAANSSNYFKTRSIERLQQRDEWQGTPPDDKTGAPSHMSYMDIRKQIIKKQFSNINDRDLHILAIATRGLIQKDIVEFVEKWLQTGKLPENKMHPTNTCHPITGSWTERLLSKHEYQKIFEANTFSLEILPGFYNTHKKGLKLIPAILLNAGIDIFGRRLAPFIFLRIVDHRKGIV